MSLHELSLPSNQLSIDQIGKLFDLSGSVRIARHGTLERYPGKGDGLLIVTGGSLMLETVLHDGQRQVLSFHFPGDLYCSAFNHHLPNSNARAVTEVQLVKIDHAAIKSSVEENEALGRAIVSTATKQMERSILHSLVLGKLNVRQRVASFLLEMALRCGRQRADRVNIPLPMTREDIGDYLGLNADTVSRTLSQFRKERFFGQSNQCEAYVNDMNLLERNTPLATALIDRYGQGNRTDMASLFAISQIGGQSGSTGAYSFGLHR